MPYVVSTSTSIIASVYLQLHHYIIRYWTYNKTYFILKYYHRFEYKENFGPAKSYNTKRNS